MSPTEKQLADRVPHEISFMIGTFIYKIDVQGEKNTFAVTYCLSCSNSPYYFLKSPWLGGEGNYR